MWWMSATHRRNCWVSSLWEEEEAEDSRGRDAIMWWEEELFYCNLTQLLAWGHRLMLSVRKVLQLYPRHTDVLSHRDKWLIDWISGFNWSTSCGVIMTCAVKYDFISWHSIFPFKHINCNCICAYVEKNIHSL